MKRVLGKMTAAINDMLNSESRGKSLSLLGIFMLISLTAVYGNFIFGNRIFIYSDIGCDTKNMYYPIYCAIVDKLRSHDFSFWSFNFGMGSNLIAYQSTIFDPFSIIVYISGLLFGTISMARVLVYVNMLKVFLSGYICYLYISSFKLSENSKIVAAYIYAFNGFMMLWGQHYFFATACLIFPLLLLSIEKSLKDKKYCIMLAVVVAVGCVYSVYMSYMMLLAAGIYAVLRLIQSKSTDTAPKFVFKLMQLAAFVIIGVMLSSIVLLPTAFNLLNVSGRINSGGGSAISTLISLLTGAFGIDYYKSVALRAISNNLQNPGSSSFAYGNYYESIQLFFSVLFLVLLPQFIINLFRKGKRLAVKITAAVGLLLILFILVNPAGSFIINAFTAPTFRYSFLLMPIFALITASALDDVIMGGYFNVPAALAVGIGCSFVLGYAYENSKAIRVTKMLVILIAVCLLFITSILYAVSRAKSKNITAVLMTGLMLFVGINVTGESYVTVNSRNFETTASIASNPAFTLNGTNSAVKYITESEKGFYRYDKTYYDWSLNDSLIENIRGVSIYNSTLNKNMIECIKQTWPEYGWAPAVYNMENGYKNAVITSLVGVKYVMSKTPLERRDYQLMGKIDGIYLYRNNDALPFGTVYHGVISENDLSRLSPIKKGENMFLNPVISDDDVKRLSYKSLLAKPSENLANSVDDAGFLNPTLTSEAMQITSLRGSSYIEGTVNSASAGFLFLSLPYEQGWHMYVDGIEKTIVKTDYAFSGVELRPGRHTIKMIFRLPGERDGMMVSIAGLVLLAAGAFIVVKGSHKKVKQRADRNDKEANAD